MKCGDKEWQHCRVEKMGCMGCYYDEIEPNEYIRTETGDIFIVDNERKVLQGLKFLDVQYGKIVEHKKSLIDLIEVGDYINGHLIVKIRIDLFNSKKQLFTEHWDYNWQGDGTLLIFYEDDIKTILTKEQYNQNCYKVKK